VEISERSALTFGEWPADIETSRLLLCCLRPDSIRAGLSGDLSATERQLLASVPVDLICEPAVLKFADAQLAADPDYLPWSARAILSKETKEMVGHLRFHTRPDPKYLQSYARDAVELGYVIFSAHRRRGYAIEALHGAMSWAEANGVRKFIASVSPSNTPSIALVAKSGFCKIGEHIDSEDGLEHVYLREGAPETWPTRTHCSAILPA
jgi:RimJ/RimL family protein N-acetyltransferase